jgi:4-hydroxybenzoate polyprenyltransferase
MPNLMKPLIKLLRPHQWIKSAFVFVGVIFGHAWGDPALLLKATLAAAGFSLAASSVYVFNDLADRERDRQHPKKRLRPLAAGTVSVGAALLLAIACGLGGLLLGWAASPLVAALILGYFTLNAGYSLGLKHVSILDVFIISAGFMLRLVAGTEGIGITASQWLLLCGMMITLFLGFAKRRAELYAMADQEAEAGSHRKVLEEYDPILLDKMIGICASATVVCYALYTLSPQTIEMHRTTALIWTVPFVLYGMFRYLQRLHSGGGEDAAREVFRDPHLILAIGGWLGLVLYLTV